MRIAIYSRGIENNQHHDIESFVEELHAYKVEAVFSQNFFNQFYSSVKMKGKYSTFSSSDDLDETIDCCFAGHQQTVFKYPKIFYYLNGHFFEKIIYSMFFDQSTQFNNSILTDKIVRENDLMNECGYLVPNDLCEIFKRIDNLPMPTF